jgi:hypothetical protein
VGPMRGAEVDSALQFDAKVDALRTDFPAIDAAIDDLRDTLRLDYDLPEIPVNADRYPNVYLIRVDYPPLGSAGRGLFVVTYHTTDSRPSPHDPYRTVTLIDLAVR